MRVEGHRITWWVWASGQKMRHTATMRGQWGWDAECSCGWASHTGGATLRCVREEVRIHMILAKNAHDIA